jgi:branched-subunit amino acid transport protein
MILSTFVVYVFITLSDSMGRARTFRIALLFIVAAALAAYFIDSIVVKVIGLSF